MITDQTDVAAAVVVESPTAAAAVVDDNGCGDGCGGEVIVSSPAENLVASSSIGGTCNTNVINTTSSSSSSSSHPMLSSGEATVIRVRNSQQSDVGQEHTTGRGSSVSQNSTTKNNSTERTPPPPAAGDDIPPMILDLLNSLYLGLEYYDRLAQEGDALDLSYMSGLFKDYLKDEEDGLSSDEDQVEEAENPADGITKSKRPYDPQLKVAKLAARYVEAAAERQRPLLVLQEGLAKKLRYLNRLVKDRTEMLRTRKLRYKVKINGEQALQKRQQQQAVMVVKKEKKEEKENIPEGGEGVAPPSETPLATVQ